MRLTVNKRGGLANIESRPLITFVLFAYNHEKYIKEAIEGAFSQTYEPLRIILSDDCSTDQTFDIIKKVYLERKCKHEVIVRRNDVNLGIIDHFNNILKNVQTDICVVAAGDDISRTDRVEWIANRFDVNPMALVVHSSVVKINQNGELLGELKPPVLSKKISPSDAHKLDGIYIGASAAYRMSLFKKYGIISEVGSYEDLVFGFRAGVLGGLDYTEEPLVFYRYGTGVSTRVPNNLLEAISIRKKKVAAYLSTVRQMQRDLKIVDLGVEVNRNIFNKLRVLCYRYAFYNDPVKLLSSIFDKNIRFVVVGVGIETIFWLKTVRKLLWKHYCMIYKCMLGSAFK